ncbi:MAG: hypothetical protein FJ088_02950, partial [Deltaproteobacteria bacterium]|nr:hypothetical protein [Deltaproteobacteria bacterium]
SEQRHSMPALSFFDRKVFSAPEKAGRERTVFTVLTERDVMMGRTLSKLKKTIDKASCAEGVGSVHVMTTCLPDLIGDNPTPFMGEAGKQGGTKIFWTSKTHNTAEVAEALYRRGIDSVKFAGERDGRCVVLGGVLSPEEKEEFSGLLMEIFGLRVAGFMLPEYDFGSYPEMGKAGSLIWVNPSSWTNVEDSIFSDYFQIVRAGTPYGIENTLNWLKGVRDRLSPETADAEIEEFYRRKFQSGIGKIWSQCGGHAVALIGDASDLEYLSTANGFCGFSVYHVLLEMGFKVRRFVYGGAAADMESFDTSDKLRDLIAGDIDAVFSSFSFDPRVNCAGKNTFSENVFEPGFSGFVRSAEKILRLCRLAPFRRFRRFL